MDPWEKKRHKSDLNGIVPTIPLTLFRLAHIIAIYLTCVGKKNVHVPTAFTMENVGIISAAILIAQKPGIHFNFSNSLINHNTQNTKI